MRKAAAGLGVVLVATAMAVIPGTERAHAADATKTITPNAPALVVTTTVANDNIRVKFQGLTGQVVSVSTTAGTFATNCTANMSIVRSDGVTLVAGPVCAGQAGALNSVTLPVNGIYQVFIDPVGVAVGTVTVGVTSTAALLSITPNAPPVTVSVPAGGSVDLGYSGTLNNYVAAKLIGGPNDCKGTFKVVKPDTTDLTGTTCSTSSPGSFQDQVIQPVGGVYKARLANTAATARNIKVQIWMNKDKTAAITVDGAAVTTATLAPAMNQSLTFSGTNGQVVSMNLSGSTLSSYCVYLRRPDTSTLASNCFGTGTGFFDAATLDVTGTWSIYVDPQSFITGKTTVELNTATIGGGTIVVDGPTKTATITTAGSVVDWTFSATLGQKVATTVSASTFPNFCFYFYKPDTSYAGGYCTSATGYFYEPITIDQAGSWRLSVDPPSNETGSATFALTSAPDVTGTITIGTAKAVATPKKGQLARYTFTGAVGQKVSVKTSAVTYAEGAYVYFYNPSGVYVFGGGYSGTDGHFQDPVTLDAAGTWTVEIDPYYDDVGGLSLLLRNTPNVTGTITIGTAKAVATTLPGQIARYTFTGAVGQKVSVTTSAVTYAEGAYVYFYNPSGDYALGGGFSGTGGHFQDPVTLDAAGTWTVEVDPYVEDVGGFSLLLRNTPNMTGTITLGTAKAVATTLPGQLARYTFAGAVGQKVSVKSSAVTYPDGAYVYFYNPSGDYAFGGGFSGTGGHFQDPVTLDAAGTWTVEVDPYIDDVGGMSLLLRTVTDLTGTITIGGPTKAVAITQPGQLARYTFSRNNGQTFKANLTGSTLTNAYVNFYDPSGNYTYGCYFTTGASTCGPHTATATGTWTVEIDPFDEETGNVTLGLTAT